MISDGFKEKLQDVVDSGTDVKISVFKGKVAKMGSRDAISINVMSNGSMRCSMSILCEETYESRGKTGTSKYFANVQSFGKMAEMMSELSEGDEVAVITRRSSRKYKDKWYENDDVLFFEKLG